MASLSNVFKAYDIRGVVPDELNALQFRAIGVAVARFTGAPTILIARDMRESGVELSEAFAKALGLSFSWQEVEILRDPETEHPGL